MAIAAVEVKFNFLETSHDIRTCRAYRHNKHISWRSSDNNYAKKLIVKDVAIEVLITYKSRKRETLVHN